MERSEGRWKRKDLERKDRRRRRRRSWLVEEEIGAEGRKEEGRSEGRK